MGKLVSFILKMLVKGGGKVKDDLDVFTRDPEKYQTELLMSIIRSAATTEFGDKYDLPTVKTVDEFRKRIPLTDYDFYSHAIERMVKGEKNVLTSDEVVHFNVTSGTLGVPKRIPVVEKHVSFFAKYNAKYLNRVVSDAIGTKWTYGKGFSLTEGSYKVLPTGVSVGCASSLQAARLSKAMPFMNLDTAKMMYTSPKEARQPSVIGTYTRYLHALFALKERNVTYGNVTFSSFLLEIMRFIENNWQDLCLDIEEGRVGERGSIPEEVAASVNKNMKPDPKRAAELRAIFEKGFESPVAPLIWPRLEFFIFVGGAGFQTYTDKLREKYFSDKIRFLYLGVSASEGLFSVPFELDNSNSVLTPDTTFMEFIPVVDGESDLSGGTKLMHELEVGRQYELVITNVNGLFRYRMKDVFEVTGFYNKTPTVQFVNRAGYAVSMFAEKTSEKALRFTAEESCRAMGLDMTDYVVCPHTDEEGGRYIFLYELHNRPAELDIAGLRDITEENLVKANPSYGNKLATGTARNMQIRILQDQTFLLYRDIMIMKGRSAAQLKPVHVTASPFQEKFFMRLEDK